MIENVVEYRYEQVAAKITQLIHRGTLRPGERIPSVRRISRQEKVSVSTALQAYFLLEDHGLIALDHRESEGLGRAAEGRGLGVEGMVELVDDALLGADQVVDEGAAGGAEECGEEEDRPRGSSELFAHTTVLFKNPARFGPPG